MLALVFLIMMETHKDNPWPKQMALVQCTVRNNTRIGEFVTYSSSLVPCFVSPREA